MESAADLVEVISSSHSPLPVVVLEEVVAVRELGWVSVGLSWLKSISTSNVGIEINILSAVKSIGMLESLIVPTWVAGLSETSLTWFLLLNVLGSKGSLWCNDKSLS